MKLNLHKYIIIGLLLFSVIFFAFKAIPLYDSIDDFYEDESYSVSYNFFYRTNDSKTQVKTYLPQNNARQKITNVSINHSEQLTFLEDQSGLNTKGVWSSTNSNTYEDISYSFYFEGKEKVYRVPSNFKKSSNDSLYLTATEFVQTNDSKVINLANSLAKGKPNDLEVLKSVFNHVLNIPSAPIITLTDAVTTIEQGRASCNGKSRLFVALMRTLGYPSRLNSGIILKDSNKRTSHVWAELKINNEWVPFDTLNGHFAYIPSNYLELYVGDEALITYSPNLDFDYAYAIEQKNNIQFLSMSEEQYGEIAKLSLLGLVNKGVVSRGTLILLLMLPVGGLLVAFLRNVVGLKTFGVFLPVLIAFALIETGYSLGMLLFIFLIMFVGIITKPFSKMGLLHTPKLVVSLTLMVVIMVVGSYIGLAANISWLTMLSVFPTIILTISAERFSNIIEEDGLLKATGILFQTLVCVSFCYFMLSNTWLASIIIVFPEMLLIIIAIALLLGRHVGLRLTELVRFRPLLNFNSAAPLLKRL